MPHSKLLPVFRRFLQRARQKLEWIGYQRVDEQAERSVKTRAFVCFAGRVDGNPKAMARRPRHSSVGIDTEPKSLLPILHCSLSRKASETDFSGSVCRQASNAPVETDARKRAPYRARRLCISALPEGSAAALYRSTVSCSNYPQSAECNIGQFLGKETP